MECMQDRQRGAATNPPQGGRADAGVEANPGGRVPSAQGGGNQPLTTVVIGNPNVPNPFVTGRPERREPETVDIANNCIRIYQWLPRGGASDPNSFGYYNFGNICDYPVEATTCVMVRSTVDPSRYAPDCILGRIGANGKESSYVHYPRMEGGDVRVLYFACRIGDDPKIANCERARWQWERDLRASM